MTFCIGVVDDVANSFAIVISRHDALSSCRWCVHFFDDVPNQVNETI